MSDDIWLFGYGSIIWRAGFPYRERRAARLPGYVRRLWQGSHDHRGTPEAPGRVVTLIEDGQGFCDGAAYLIDSAHAKEVLVALDYREKNGYERCGVRILLSEGQRLPRNPGMQCTGTAGLTYLAPPGNHAFLGEAPLEEIALQVRRSVGPSGANIDYVRRLAESVRELGGEDRYLHEVYGAVRST